MARRLHILSAPRIRGKANLQLGAVQLLAVHRPKSIPYLTIGSKDANFIKCSERTRGLD